MVGAGGRVFGWGWGVKDEKRGGVEDGRQKTSEGQT